MNKIFKVNFKTSLARLFYLFSLCSFYASAIPGKPSYTSASVSGTSITVSWGAVSGASYYRLQYRDNGGKWGPPVGMYTGSSQTWANFSGTLSNRSYSAQACDNSGCGQWSTASAAITYPVPIPVPSPPNLTMPSSGVSGVGFNIVFPTVANTSYQLYENGQILTTRTSSPIYRVIDEAGSFSYQLKACNTSNVCSGLGNTTSTIIEPDAPSYTAASVSGSTITVSWGASSPSGVHYQLRYRDGANDWVESGITYSGVSNRWDNITTAIIDRSYSMKACVGSFCSSWSNPSAAINYVPSPSAPVAAVSGSSITVSWQAVAGASYQLSYRDGNSDWIDSSTFTSTSNTWPNITETITNRSYSIKACIGSYCSLRSAASNSIDYSPAAAPSQITLKFENYISTNEYTIEWEAQSIESNSYVLEQNIDDQLLPNGDILWQKVTVWTGENKVGNQSFTNLLDGKYQYRVRACDGEGELCNLTSNILSETHTENGLCMANL